MSDPSGLGEYACVIPRDGGTFKQMKSELKIERLQDTLQTWRLDPGTNRRAQARHPMALRWHMLSGANIESIVAAVWVRLAGMACFYLHHSNWVTGK